jgi:hypothetical protein
MFASPLGVLTGTPLHQTVINFSYFLAIDLDCLDVTPYIVIVLLLPLSLKYLGPVLINSMEHSPFWETDRF